MKHDLSNRRFGTLTVVGYGGRRNKLHYWDVLCDCGFGFQAYNHHLLSGKTTRCKPCAVARQRTNGRMSANALKRIKQSAAKRGIEYSIDRPYLIRLFNEQGGICPYSGAKIGFAASLTESGRGGDTASLDRIDSSSGYVPGNVHWVHKVVNMMKWSLSESEFVDWCSIIANYRADLRES